MHGCFWKEGRGGLLKSSTLGKEEGRGWVDGACFPRGDAATHCSKRCQTLGSSLALPSRFARFNLSAPPRRQLDPYGGKRGGKKRKCVCGLCHGVCHLLSHITLGIVSKVGRLRGDASCEDAALLLVKQRIWVPGDGEWKECKLQKRKDGCMKGEVRWCLTVWGAAGTVYCWPLLLRTQAVPQIEEGAVTETQTKGSDLTK